MGLLKEQDLTIEIDNKAITYLAEHGYSAEYGARPLRRLLQKELDNVISNRIINGEIKSGEHLYVTENGGPLSIEVKKPAKVKK